MDDLINPYAAPASNVDTTAPGTPPDASRTPLPERLTIDAHLTHNDWHAYQRFWEHGEMTRPLPALGIAALGLLWLAVLSALIAVARDPTSTGSLAALFLLLAGLFHVAVTRYRRRQAVKPTGDGVFLGKHRFEFSADGVRDRSMHCDSLTRWHVVSSIERTDELLVIGLGQVGAFVIPTRYLEEPEAFVQALEALRDSALSDQT